MKVSNLNAGMLLRPKLGFEWRLQKSVYADRVLCLTVERCPKAPCKDNVVIYVGERDYGDISYGKQIVLWEGRKISVNPSAWRCIVSAEAA
tara:strand:- start:361 stop:633 length:273 start_codon:yes stop_codon:yes gene_type:complete